MPDGIASFGTRLSKQGGSPTYRPLASISGTVTEEPVIVAPPPPHRHHHPGHVLMEELYVELIRFGAHADAAIISVFNRIKSEFR